MKRHPPNDAAEALARSDPASTAPTRWQESARPALLSTLWLSVITGFIFPLALLGLGRLTFPDQAAGSLITNAGVIVGSRLIGQPFARADYFHSRPSAAGAGYDGSSSGGTNLGPSNPKLLQDIRRLADDYRRSNGLAPDAPVPIDAVTRSGSGLDPHISPENAALQVPRVARQRGISEDIVRRLVADHTQGRQLGFMGQPRVWVLDLNLALDQVGSSHVR